MQETTRNRKQRTIKLGEDKKGWEKEIHKYLRILEAGTIKQAEMNEKFQKENLRRAKPNWIAQISSKWLTLVLFPLVRYSESFLKWTREELQQMDQRIRKHMTMHKARDDDERLFERRVKRTRLHWR